MPVLAGQLVDRDPRSLDPAPYNPRAMGADERRHLERSVRELGVIENVVVNRRTGRIVSGHQRVVAAVAAGLPTVPVYELDVDEATERQVNLHMNRTRGEWDDGMLADVLRELDAMGADLAPTGFLPEEVDLLLAGVDAATMLPVGDGASPSERRDIGRSEVPTVKVVLAVPDLAACEEALASAGTPNRGEALLAICRHYLDHPPVARP